eukprot:TRINITY_DN3746_c0_g1_i1.p1 TRINITY_DN3746_c0_g1~~TRINITY_DN3746_c0_g1_i1.p1  ORF type:complete len:128 (+),score=9.01 TRINITY_DN3746_c0_g1_i1:60-443(+)
MRLIVHNMLRCNLCKHFPLQIVATKIETIESELNKELLEHMLQKLEWSALVTSCKEVSIVIPSTQPSSEEMSEEIYANIHKVLFDVHIKEGELRCSKCNRVYNITNGIPNMLLTPEEVQTHVNNEKN